MLCLSGHQQHMHKVIDGGELSNKYPQPSHTGDPGEQGTKNKQSFISVLQQNSIRHLAYSMCWLIKICCYDNRLEYIHTTTAHTKQLFKYKESISS